MPSVRDFEKQEAARIREHLIGALSLLREADTSRLLVETRARRASVAADLADYIERGRFPRNSRTLDRRPALIDELGTRCALAHLAERSGGADVIRNLSHIANHERVATLRTHDGLGAWLESVGLTPEEAARIQPSYTYYTYPPPLECACAEMSGPVARGTIVASGSGQCDVRIDKVLSEGDGSLRAGETVTASCTAASGIRMLVSRPRASKDWALRLDGNGPLRFETCKAYREGGGGASSYRGARPAAQLVPRQQIDAVIGKTEAECREHFKLGPYTEPEHEDVMDRRPRTPAPSASASPVPSGIIAPNAEKASSEEPAPILPKESEASRGTDDSMVVLAPKPESFELTPIHYVGAGGAVLVVSAAVGFVLLRRASKG